MATPGSSPEYDHILGIYRLYRGTLVPDDDFGNVAIR